MMYSKEIEEWKEEFYAEEARNEAHRYSFRRNCCKEFWFTLGKYQGVAPGFIWR